MSHRWDVYEKVCYDMGVSSGEMGEIAIPEDNDRLQSYLATLPLWGDHRDNLTNAWIDGYEYGDDLSRS